jgi:hypothetical protein
MSATDWKRSENWMREGKNFLVKINRHEVKRRDEEYSYEGPHRWCVYAYIYPKHPRFPKFEGSAMWQPAATALPMHGGPSLLTLHYDDDGKVLSVEVGCDYNHLHDDRYTHMENADQACGVFNDAEDLFDFLQSEATS